ncbi:hypothetical protein C2W62_44070, partial [Candidatus Entotheonella serta]
MRTHDEIDAQQAKEALQAFASKNGALVCGVAAVEAFHDDAPEGFRPTDILPRAKTVVVVGGKIGVYITCFLSPSEAADDPSPHLTVPRLISIPIKLDT